MVLWNCHLLHIVVATILMAIYYEPAMASITTSSKTKPSMTVKREEAEAVASAITTTSSNDQESQVPEVHVRLAQKNMAAYANVGEVSRQQQRNAKNYWHSVDRSNHHQKSHQDIKYGNLDGGVLDATEKSTVSATTKLTRRADTSSFRSSRSNKNKITSKLNGLANLSSSQHISDPYTSASNINNIKHSLQQQQQQRHNEQQRMGRVIREQIPIYEEQHDENDYDATAGVSGTAIAFANHQHNVDASQHPAYSHQYSHSDSGSIVGSNWQHQNPEYYNNIVNDNGNAVHNAIYNLHAAGSHNGGFVPSLGLNQRYSSITAGITSAATSAAPVSPSAATATIDIPIKTINTINSKQDGTSTFSLNDKISTGAEGNFLHHYEQYNSGKQEHSSSNELAFQKELQQQVQQQVEHQLQQQFQQQQHQQQQEFHQQQQEQLWQSQYQTPFQYFMPHDASHDAITGAGAHSSTPLYEEEANSNYLPTSPSAHGNYDDGISGVGGTASGGYKSHEAPPNVINYVPYPVVKKLHVPVREPVQIPVSHAILMPVSKPVPIHIPVPKQVQVPIEKELKIPIERVVPYPVEKHVPIPVEKRVPYPVVKYVPVKVPRPFPVKVPVFKTILHKIKGWW